MTGKSNNIKIHLLTDNTGYYITGQDISNNGLICKYIFSTPSLSCQKLDKIYSYPQSSYFSSPDNLILTGVDKTAPCPLHFYQYSFQSTSFVSAKIMNCTSGICNMGGFESQQNSTTKWLHTLFSYGSTFNMYFATMTFSSTPMTIDIYSTNSSANMMCTDLYSSTLNENIFYAAGLWSGNSYFLAYNITSNGLQTRLFSAGNIYGLYLDEYQR